MEKIETRRGLFGLLLAGALSAAGIAVPADVEARRRGGGGRRSSGGSSSYRSGKRAGKKLVNELLDSPSKPVKRTAGAGGAGSRNSSAAGGRELNCPPALDGGPVKDAGGRCLWDAQGRKVPL